MIRSLSAISIQYEQTATKIRTCVGVSRNQLYPDLMSPRSMPDGQHERISWLGSRGWSTGEKEKCRCKVLIVNCSELSCRQEDLRGRLWLLLTYCSSPPRAAFSQST